MKQYSADKIRNIAIVGHGSSGKTSLTAAFLFDSKVTNRLTRVDNENTITDYDPDEKQRKISINSAICHFEWNNHKINLIDCPGYSNFLWDARAGLRAVDAGALVVCAVSGVEVGTEKCWEMMEELGLPRIFIVNKLDRENSDFSRTVDSIQDFFGRQAVPVQIPIGSEQNFKGVIDLIEKKAYLFKGGETGGFTKADIPDDMKKEAEKKAEELTEMIAENDEQLMEKYFENGKLSTKELIEGFKKSVFKKQIFPLFLSSAEKNIGTHQILDGIVDLLPNPLERGEIKAGKGYVKLSADSPFSSFVFKTISDPYTGRISLMRIFSGKVTGDSSVFNSVKDKNEKFNGLFFMQGKEQEEITNAGAGDIVGTAKLKVTATSDTLCDKSNVHQFEPINFPKPSISFAIKPKTREDEDKISQAVHRIKDEDPTAIIARDSETNELIISGNGQLHVEIIAERLKKRFNVDVELKPPKISYKETIKGKSDVQGRYKKQTGGRGQYGDVHVKFEPLPRGKDFEFENKVFGGAIPKNYIPSVEKGIEESRKRGIIAGYPTVDFKAILYDGTYHEVDSSDIAFKVAASLAFKKGIKAAKPIIIEPIMNVEVYTTETYMGDIMGNLNGRRGKVQGMEQKGNMRIIKAQVPMAEMLDFEPTLTSITGGRGSFIMEMSHYEEVPAHLLKDIIEDSIREGRIKKSDEDE